MSTIHHDDIRTGSPAAYLATRGLATVAGLVGLAGATFFTFVASPADGGVDTPFQWFVGLWKMAIALIMLAGAIVPGVNRERRLAIVTWAAIADLAFCAVKLGVYHESAAVPFVVVDLGLLALARTASPARPR